MKAPPERVPRGKYTGGVLEFILMTGRNTLKNKDSDLSFLLHQMPGAGKRGVEVIDISTFSIIS